MPDDLVALATQLLAKARAGTLTGHETDMLRRAVAPPGPDGKPADADSVQAKAAAVIARHFDAEGRPLRGAL